MTANRHNSLFDGVDRWAVLLYCLLPSSYLTPSLGRSEEDSIIASGVCSLLTITCLVAFCVMTICVV